MIVANELTPVVFQLSPGSCHGDPEVRLLIPMLGECFCNNGISLLMDKAYEGDEVRSLAVKQGLKLVVPPKSNRKKSWEYDRDLYKRRNEVERFFRRLKAYSPCYVLWGHSLYAVIFPQKIPILHQKFRSINKQQYSYFLLTCQQLIIISLANSLRQLLPWHSNERG